MSVSIFTCFAALASGVFSFPAQAVTPAATHEMLAPDTIRPVRFNIPAQPLRDAVEAFSAATGIRVEIQVDNDIRSNAVNGDYSAPVALRALASGHAIAVRFERSDFALLRPVLQDDAPMYSLTAVTITGERVGAYIAQRTRTATKTDTPLRDTPQSVSVITRDVIRDMSMQGMSDIVRYVPGVTMGQGEGHRDAPTIRGNSSTADFFVDGVRDDAQYYRDLYNVERVEALKGPNAMIFGRGGAGGVINRVLKQPALVPVRNASISAGSFGFTRFAADLGDVVRDRGDDAGTADVAYRINGLYENSGGFRDAASTERFGVNPTVAVISDRTVLRAGYEYFSDSRNVDRGIPSFQSGPFSAPIRTFFGNADSSYGTMRVSSGSAAVEHQTLRGMRLRNRFQALVYDKFYQNSFASSAVTAGMRVPLSAYNNATDRRSISNQLEAAFDARTGSISHTAVFGIEAANQRTSNFRNTGFYNDSVTSYAVDVTYPRVVVPISFRQNATDADNQTVATAASVFAQDQLQLSAHWQAIAGARFERFDVRFSNHRNGEELKRSDDMISPRLGLVFKPTVAASLYGSYSVSYLPSSGDQFSSLTATTKTLEPEQLVNYEAGAKWDVNRALSVTAAAYRLDRTNTSAPDPLDAARTVQTGSQRTRGIELGAAGRVTQRWQIVGGAAFQRASILTATRAAPAGAEPALVPHTTASLWSRYQLLHWIGTGVGVVYQADSFAAVDNSVTLPEFTRLDGALFIRVNALLSAQVNVENILDVRYYPTSHGNNNIMPGAPRTVRLTLAGRH